MAQKHSNSRCRSLPPAARGCYNLIIHLNKKRWIRVGKLGRASFPPGVYLYTGSAMNGLRGRLSRHLRKRNKKTRWHIDYLLRRPEARVKDIRVYPPSLRECRINRRLLKLDEARIVLQGFGSSDCVSGCATHLLYFPRRDSGALTNKLPAAPGMKEGGLNSWKLP